METILDSYVLVRILNGPDWNWMSLSIPNPNVFGIWAFTVSYNRISNTSDNQTFCVQYSDTIWLLGQYSDDNQTVSDGF